MANQSNEHDLQNRVLNQYAHPSRRGTVKGFRANVGTGWTANTKDTFRFSKQEAVVVQRGDVLLRNARPFSTGLPNGFPDTFGWQETVITPDMVGQTVAIFWGAELKYEAKATPEQLRFIEAGRRGGAKTGIVKSEQDACDLLGVNYEPDANRRSR